MDARTLLRVVGQTLPEEDLPILEVFLRWHAQVPFAHHADPRGVWMLFQSVRACIPAEVPSHALREHHIEAATLVHLLSQARPPLTWEERRDALRFYQQGGYQARHLTGITESFRRWRAAQTDGG